MSPNFNQTGVVDLSQIAGDMMAKQAVAAGASYVTELTETNFEDIIRRSVEHVVIIELTSPRAKAEQMSADLDELANKSAGRFLLARANVDEQPKIAQAFQVQGVPAVFGVIGGQLAPLWQGTKDSSEMQMIINELMSLAMQSGITGRAEPIVGDDTDEPDPRFLAADTALAEGDYAQARLEFDKVLEQFPNDQEALAGKAQAGLLERTSQIDPTDIFARADQSGSLDDQLAAADLEMMQGQPEKAFARLIGQVRDRSAAEKETARRRLLELFETLGNSDERVNKARRDLMTALF